MSDNSKLSQINMNALSRKDAETEVWPPITKVTVTNKQNFSVFFSDVRSIAFASVRHSQQQTDASRQSRSAEMGPSSNARHQRQSVDVRVREPVARRGTDAHLQRVDESQQTESGTDQVDSNEIKSDVDDVLRKLQVRRSGTNGLAHVERSVGGQIVDAMFRRFRQSSGEGRQRLNRNFSR